MDNDTEFKNSKIPTFFLGVVVGLMVALFLLILFNLFFNSKPQPTETTKVLKLDIAQPADNIATSKKTFTLEGSTGIKSIVTLTSGNQSKIVEPVGNRFSATIDLKEGKNVITIGAFDPKTGESQTETKEILMLEEDLTNL